MFFCIFFDGNKCKVKCIRYFSSIKKFFYNAFCFTTKYTIFIQQIMPIAIQVINC